MNAKTLIPEYRDKIMEIYVDKIDSIKVVEHSDEWSHWNESTATICMYKDHANSTFWHEFGHVIFSSANIHRVRCNELTDEIFENGLYTMKSKDVESYLHGIMDSYKIKSVHGIITLSDALGLLMGIQVYGFHSHEAGYNGFETETVANFTSSIMMNREKEITMMLDKFPNVVNDVLNIIDNVWERVDVDSWE